ELEQIESRIQPLRDSVTHAEQSAQKALGPDGDLQKHREAVQHLSSQALQTQASIDALKKDRAAIDELRDHVRAAEAEMKQSLGQAGTLKSELDQVRTAAAALTQEYVRTRDTSREAREDTAAAMTTIKEVEAKLGPLAQLHELSQHTDERLAALNALAEH